MSVVAGNNNEQTISTVTDTHGNVAQRVTGSHVFSPYVYSGASLEIWCFPNYPGGTVRIKASWPQGGGYSQTRVAEYHGIALTTPVDNVAPARATARIQSAPMAMSHSSDLILAVWMSMSTGCTAATGFTDRTPGGVYFEDIQTIAAGSLTVTQNGCANNWFVGAFVGFISTG